MNPIAERGPDDDILQIGDAFALEALPPRRLNGSQQKVGFVGARKSSHSCFVDFVPLETDARIDCGSGRPPNPELSRFVLCTPNQYIASKTLRAFEEWSGGSYAEGEQLKLMADKEKVSNAAVMRSSRGKPALFGGVFQLQHPAGHFLDLNKQMATEEPAALRCGLADPDERTKHTWFRFLPGFRTRKEGEPIRMGDTVTIQSMKKSSNLFMHVGKDVEMSTGDGAAANPDGSSTWSDEHKTRSELNLCSPKGDFAVGDNPNMWRAQFRIVPVAKFNNVEKKESDVVIRGGDYAEVFHRQSQGYLAVDTRVGQRRCRLFRPIPDSKEADPVSTVAAELVWKLMTPKMAWSGEKVALGGRDGSDRFTQALCLNAANQCGEDLFLAEGEDGNVELVLNADDPAAQWHLQPFDSVEGGFKYDLSKFFLVNVETGNILHQGKEESSRDPDAEDGHAWFDLKAIPATIEHESDVFVLHSLGNTGDSNAWLADFQTAEEGMDGLWAFHSEVEAILNMDGEKDGSVQQQRQKAKRHGSHDGAGGKKQRGSKKKRGPKRMVDGMHFQDRLQQIEEGLTTLPHPNLHLGEDLNRDHEPPPPKDTRSKDERISDLLATYVSPPTHHWDDWAGPVLNDLRIFIGNVTSGMGDNPLFWDGAVRLQQQQILSGLGMIPFLVHMLQSLLRLFDPDSITDADYPHLLLVVKGTFHLLKCLVKGNNRNAFQLYKHHEWMAEMVQHQTFNVVYSITEIFKGTPALLHSSQLELFIHTFWQMGVEVRHARFLVFLIDICFDELGKPLDSNQEDVVIAIKENLPDDLFQETSTEDVIKVKSETIMKNDTHGQNYRFVLAMVELAAAICDGRMQNGLQLFLQDAPMFQFSYGNILSKISDSNATVAGYLPDSSFEVRRVYIKAMWAMYVDRQYTGMERQTRQRTRIWDGIDKAALNIQARHFNETETQSVANLGRSMEFDVTPGFGDLKDALHQILVDCAGGINSAETKKNLMLLDALGLMQYIIRQGYYDPRPLGSVDDGVLLLGDELKDLVAYLVKLMDGRDDTGFVDARRRRELDSWELDMMSKPGSAARFEVNQENRIVFRIKTRSLEILNDLLDIKASSRVDHCMKALQKASTAGFRATGISGGPSTADLAAADGAMNEMQNPLASTFEVEGSNPESPGSEIEMVGQSNGAAPPSDRMLDVDADDEDDDFDPIYDRKTRRIAAAAMKSDRDNAAKLSMFRDQEDEDRISQILLDSLRYTENEALVLSSFAALHHYKGEGARFVELLKAITLVTTPEDALLFLALYRLMANFRKSIARLLERTYAELCVSTCKEMAKHCMSSATARTLLRNIKIDRYVAELLLTHPNNVHPELFIEVVTHCLRLVSALCHDTDQLSQALLADRLETVFLPLLHGGPTDGDPPLEPQQREQIMRLTARVMTHMFIGNRELSMSFSALLTQVVVEQMRVFGKNLDLLGILMPLIQVDGKSVEASQTFVSKGFVEKSGDGLDGRMMPNEWGPGPGMEFNEVVEHALISQTDESGQPTRQEMEMRYYCMLTETVGMCARGLMPHTELQAASMMTFDQCMNKLLMLYQNQALSRFQDDDRLTEVKRVTLLFLNDVFVDSDSEFTQAVVQQRMNGLWTMPPRDHENRSGARYTPLGEILVADLNKLDRNCSTAFRSYVFAEVVEFFVLYCVSASKDTTTGDEEETITDSERLETERKLETIQKAYLAALDVIKRMRGVTQGLTEAEAISAQHLANVTKDWLDGADSLPAQHLESFRRAGAAIPDRVPSKMIMSEVDTVWKCFVEKFETENAGLVGFLEVAKDLNLEIPDSDDKYSQSLLIAARTRIQKLQGQLDYKMPSEESRLLCSVLDIIRAMPYVVHGEDKKLKDDQVKKLYDEMDMGIFVTPSVPVSESQIQLCSEGWGLLCWNILATAHFPSVHLAAVRLLQTMLGGGNFDVQTTLLNDLTDRSKTGRELLGSSCRRILRDASDELRSLRKKKHSTRDNDILLVASHVLTVLVSSCEHQHTGMQGYIPNQYGHEETYLLVPDIYEFTVEVEREIKFAIENNALDTLHHRGKAGTIYLLDVLETSFSLFSRLCSGPNEANQLVIAASGILLVINRIHSYSLLTDKSELEKLDHVDPSPNFTEAHWQKPSLVKCRLNSYTKELLLTLLEGSADKIVVGSICQSLDFNIYAQHMRVMKNICDNMTDSNLKVSSAIRTSGWVRAQCFQFITILEKLVSSDLPRKAMLPLMPVLRQKPMMEWYRARLGQAEVVRNGQLESLYFEMPTRWLEPAAYAEMVDETTILMDEAFNSANSHADRVSGFVENVIEYIWTIDRNQRDMTPLARKVLLFLRVATGKWYLLILSLSINVVCLLALGTADDSAPPLPLQSEGSDDGFSFSDRMSFEDLQDFEFKNPSGVVYERWTQGEAWINTLAPLHLLVSILSVFQFLMVKNPILSNVSSRAKMLRRMQRLRHSKQAVGSGFEDFVVCTIHVKELPPPRSAWNPEGYTAAKLKAALIVYGEIGGITMWGRNSQQALVSFLQEDAVDRVTDTLVDVDAREWNTGFAMSANFATNAITGIATGTVKQAERVVGAGSSAVKSGSARMPGLGNSRLVGNLNALGKEISESAEKEMTRRTAHLLEEVDKEASARGVQGGIKSHIPGADKLLAAAEQLPSPMGPGSRWQLRSTAQEISYRHLNIAKISLEQATRSTGEFSEKLKSAAREYSEGTSEGSSTSIKKQVKAVIAQATNLNMAIANVIALLTYDVTDREASSFISTTSSDSLISLKLGPHLLRVLVDLVFSICGCFGHPLFFAYHLFHLFNARAATIVLRSITTNLSRLTTTLILALLLMYFFAILGYIFFSDRHIVDHVSNEGGPCSNLLTCFISYSFAGFLQTGLMYWLKRPAFPEGAIETSSDIFGTDGTRILFEVAFMLIMSVVVISIITGIIVDTFGELRVAQDIAARYRRSTCFITGIPFTQVPEQKKTSYLQYVFLLVFLRRKKLLGVRPLEPLERLVADKVDVGDISWLPLGRDASIDDENSGLLSDGLSSSGAKNSRGPVAGRQIAEVNEKLEILAESIDRIEARQLIMGNSWATAEDPEEEGGGEGASDMHGLVPEAAEMTVRNLAMASVSSARLGGGGDSSAAEPSQRQLAR